MSQDILNEFNLNNHNNSLNMMNNINNNNNNIDTIDTKHQHNNHLDHQSNMDTTTSSFDDIQMDKSPALSSLSSPLNISSATTIMADNESPTTIDGTMMMERSSLPSG